MASKIYTVPAELSNLTQFDQNNSGSLVLNSKLRWPIADQHDFLQIDIVEFQLTGDVQYSVTQTPVTNTPKATEAASESAITEASTTNVSFDITDGTFFSNTQSKKTQAKIFEQIRLPIPANVNYQDNPKYNEGSGIAGKILPSLAKQIANDASSANIATTLQAAAKAGSQGLVMSVLDKLPGLGGGAAQLTQNGFGKILNPYVEQVFGGVGMRTFSFNWKLVPRNDEETDAIQNIIKVIRGRSLPDYAAKLGLKENGGSLDAGNISDRWLTVPMIFRLNWKNGDTGQQIKSLPKIKPCVLTDAQINYTPDNIWATYEGANPVAYDLTLGFTETEIITSQEVLALGY